MGDKSSGEGPPPPSPLTGAYLLIVLPQTHQLQHKDYVIHNLTKGLLTWDKTDCHVDLEKELQTITAQAPEGEEAKNGERLIQFASENLVTEVLIHPQLNTLVQCMRNLLSSFTRHRHIIHAGYTCAGNGAWMLQDGTYSYADFSEMYQEHEVQRVLRAYENTVSVDVHCLQEGDWNNLKGKDPFSKVSRVRLNPKDCVTSTPAIKGFLDYLSPYVTNGSIDELLESSDVVGNIRFSHPTLYVFPGGQGDAALFGINGFNMLVDGGFARKACFWDFSRHLDRLDAVLMTRLNNGNIQGMTSLLQRKRMDHVYPQIGHFFCNMQERRHPLSPDGDKDRDPLLISLFDQGQDILGSLRHLQLKPQPCYRDPVLEPVNLYHKVGHGKLDMYVISPAKDSREVREFMAKWTTQDTKIFCSFTKRGGEFNFPLCNKVSICVLLVWQPANPEDNITRLLFPGSTPQHKIFEGLDKLKNLEFMKHAVCSARTLSPSSSSVGLNIRTVSKPKVPASVDKIIENDDKKIEAVKQPIMKPPIGQTEKQPPKSQPPSRPPSKQKPAEKPKEKPKTEVEVKTEKTETAKTEKAKPDKIEKTEAVQKIDKSKEKPKRHITKQPEKKKPVGGEKKDSLKSSPTTPKKIAENKVSEAQPKPEVKSRASSRTKPSPSATPAKSAKEANNRKVLEQKKEATKRAPPPKKEETKKAERSTAPKKSVPSPSKADKQQVSPVKAPRPVIKPKQDTKKIAKPEKEVVTESVASTPSTVDVELAKAKEDVAEKEKRVEEIKVAGAAETAEHPSISKDEEDEILVIEKIEIEGDGKGKPEESIAVHIRNSREDIIADEEAAKDEANADLPSDEKKEIMKTSDITIPDTDSKQFSEDVQDITKDAPDTSKSRVEFMTTEEASITKEPATDKLTPKEKDGKEKSTDIGDIKQTDESQPDEKFSTTVESGATTAPTLPEDERIPLDEIKEIIEEKYIKEETKEKDTGVTHRPEQPTSLPEVPVISSTPFDQRVQLLKDIVKTPDEVADLPVHEEADGGIFGVDETQLARDVHKSRDDFLGIPAPKKPIEKKEDAAEEVKLVKDENEKEDATKDLKEDDIVDEKAALSATAPFGITDHVDVEEHETQPDAVSQKPDDNIQAPEKNVVDGLVDNEALKSSAVPTSLDDEEILDEDKDKETEKEKLLLKESRDLDKDEDVADKADKEMLNEKQVAKSVVQEEIKGQKPVPEDVSPEELSLKTEVVQDSNKTASDQAGLDNELTKLKDFTKVDHKSKSPSPDLEAKSTILTGEKEKLPSPGLTAEEVKADEAIVKSLKLPSSDSRTEETKDIERVLETSDSPLPGLKKEEANELEAVIEQAKSPSPQPKDEQSKGVETVTEASKSPSPMPKIDDSKGAISKSPSPEPKAGEPKDVESIVKPSKSPSPEPKDEIAKDSVEAASKASKSPSPEPKVKDSKEIEAVAKSSSLDPKIEDTEDGETITKAPESPSPELKDDGAGDIEAFTKTSKSPSPEPKIKDTKAMEAVAKSSTPDPNTDNAKDGEAIAKASKSPSPEVKMDDAKDRETIAKASKSSSPELKMEDARDGEAIAKASKSPSPEVKMDDAKDRETIAKASKSSSPELKMEDARDGEAIAKASKSPSPEPKIDDAKGGEAVPKTSVSSSPELKMDDAKGGETIAKASKSPSPEPKIDDARGGEAVPKTSVSSSPELKMDDAKGGETIAKASKSSSPELKMDDAMGGETIAKTSKSPSPEPKIDDTKDDEAVAKASKSPSPELKMDDAKGGEMIAKASKSPSPEPKMADSKDSEAVVKASKSPSPELNVDDAKDGEMIEKAPKSPSPEPKMNDAQDGETLTKASKSPSPDLKKDDAKDGETVAKASKSPSPEPKKDDAKDGEAIAKPSKSAPPEPKMDDAKGDETIAKASKSPSPEPKMDDAKGGETIAKASKSPSPELKMDDAKDGETIAKASKSPSPEPKIDYAKDGEAIAKASKSPSPEPKKDDAKEGEAIAKASKSPSPELKMDNAKSGETIAKASKSPSPEPKIDDAKDGEAIAKSSKSPSPEPKKDDAKEGEAIIAKASKSPSPEPKMEDAKGDEANAKTSISPSPERKMDDAKDGEAIVSASKLPSPELKMEDAKDSERIAKASKSPSPEPKMDDAKDGEAIAKTSKSPSPEPTREDAKDGERLAKESKSPSPTPNLGDAKEIEATAKAAMSPSPEPKGEEARTVNAITKSPSPEPKPQEAKAGDAITKESKSPSPEPKMEEDKEIEADVKSSKPLSPELKIADQTKDIDSLVKSSKSPSPEPKADILKDNEGLAKSPLPFSKDDEAAVIKSTAPTSPELKSEESKDVDATKASKSPSPELKADHTKLEPLDKSPDVKPEAAAIDALIKEHKSPSPVPKADEDKDIETIIKTSKSPSPDQLPDQAKTVEPSAKSPEPTAEEASDTDGLIKVLKSPSPDPKLDDGKSKDSELADLGKPSSMSPLPEPKAKDSNGGDPQEKSSKSPSPESIGTSIGKHEEIDYVSKSLEPKVEHVGELATEPGCDIERNLQDLKDDEPRSPSPLLKEEESKPLEAHTTLSKSPPTPEPKVDKLEVDDSKAKESVSHSPDQKFYDSKLKELSPQLSKSPTPEPSTDGLEVAISPSPKPETKVTSSCAGPADAISRVPEDSISKSPSPEPVADVSKRLELTGMSFESPSPEPEKPKEIKVETSGSPEKKIAGSSFSEIEIFDESQTKVSKSPSPEPMIKVPTSPEPVIKASKSPSPEPVAHGGKPTDRLTEAIKTSEPTAKSPEPSVVDSESPHLQSDEIKDVMEKLEAQLEGPKLTEPLTKVSKSPSPEPIKSLEPQTQLSKSPSPEPSAEFQRSQHSDQEHEQSLQKEVISKSVEQHDKISDSVTQEVSEKDSLMPQPDTSKSPSSEPHANDLKSISPLPLEPDDGKSDAKAIVADDVSSDIIDDALAKKVKTKEELNQELVEEKEIDEVSEPERKDLKNLQTKLGGEASSKTSSGGTIDIFGESKVESSKLEAEKHEKEMNLEQECRAKHDDSAEKEILSTTIEKQTLGEKEIDQSLANKSDGSKEDEKLCVESKLVASDHSAGGFKMDDRVPSISLREASVDHTSEEAAPHKQAEIDKAPGDLERDIISTPGDRKTSSGEVSTKSTDADTKTVSDEERKLSDAGSIGSEKSVDVSPKGTIKVEGEVGVEEVLTKIESPPPPGKHAIEETGDRTSHAETYEEKVGRLEKSIADDREMLRELIKANEESKISTQLQLDKSQSDLSAQDKLDGIMPESTKEAKVEESPIEQSLPESIKLEADKDSVEIKSKGESKDEALVLDFDLPDDIHMPASLEGTKKPEEASGSDSKETVSKISETSLVSDSRLVCDGLEGIKDTIDKTLNTISVETSLAASVSSKTDSYSKDLVADSSKEQPKSESDKSGMDMKPETKVLDHDDKFLTKSPSPSPALEGKDDKKDLDVKDDTIPDAGKSLLSEEIKDGKDVAVKPLGSISPEKSPPVDKKIDILAKIDQETRSTTTPEPHTKPDSLDVASSDVKVLDSKVEDVTVEKRTELTSAPSKGGDVVSSKVDSKKEELPLVTSDESKTEKPAESDKAAGTESFEISHTSTSLRTGAVVGDGDSLHEKEMKPSEATLSTEEKMVYKREHLEEMKDTSKEVIGSTAGVTEQLQFATSTVDLKQTLESIEPLVVEESKSATVTAKSITEKDVGEITTTIVTKTEEQTSASENMVDESMAVKSSKESIVSKKDSLTHSTDLSALLTNGKTATDSIHETEGKKTEDTGDEKEHGVKKSDIRVTDILDTAERIVSSLNGKKTISDEPSDYIPSFSETKSYTMTIEGKKGPSDEITVETKTIEEGEVVHTDSYCGTEGASFVSKHGDASILDAEKKPTTTSITSQDMNGHSKLYKEEECKMDLTTTSSAISCLRDDVGLSSSALTSEAQKKSSEILTSSGGKFEDSFSKTVAPKDDSSAVKSDKSETEKLGEPSASVSQSVTKVISETATTIGETVSSIGSFLPSDLLKSSTSSAKGSTTASPDLSRKSDDASSTTQQDAPKGILGSKLHLASKESLIDVTSNFLSMESGVSQSSEKSVDTSVSSSKSGEKVTETTDKKSSLSSTQVEPPTEKDQPILHSTTAALRTQKDFSRSETPASDILSDRDVEIGHCTPYSDTSSGQVSRAVTHVWETVEGRPESRHYDSDEDMPGSPMSISSHIPSPPQFEYDMSRPQDPMMMSSFYGSLPGDLEEGVKAISGEMASAYDYSVHDKGDISLKKELGGDKLSASIRSSLTSTPESSPLPERRFEPLLATSGKETPPPEQAVPPPVLPSSSSASPKPDPIGKWDKPLGLPPPHSTDSSTPYLRWNPYKEWGKPLGLPSPAPPPREDTDIEVDTSGSAKTTPKKVSKMNAENNKYSSNAAKEASNKSKRSESPVKKPSGKDSRKSGPTPLYMDLSYVPHHGNSNYATVEFFKRVRARYYVFSGTEPSKEVFNALLEAKQSWEDKDLEVTIIPTYDTDTLGYWIAENEEMLSKLKIDLSPSASRCTINLQDHDTSCSAYRLEF